MPILKIRLNPLTAALLATGLVLLC